MATLTQTPLQVSTPGDIPTSLMALTPCPSLLCQRHQSQPVHTYFPPGSYQPPYQINFFHCRRKWTWPWSNCWQPDPPGISATRSWTLNMEPAVCLNKVQTTQVIRQARLHGTIVAYTLQKVHHESILVLEWQVTEEERKGRLTKPQWRPLWWPWDPAHLRAGEHFCTPTTPHQQHAPGCLFLGYWPPPSCWSWQMKRPVPAAPIPRVPEMSSPPTGTKCQHCSSDQDVPIPRQDEEETLEPEYPTKECPHQKRDGPWQRPLKNPTVRPSLRSQQSCRWQGGPISRPTSPTSSMRG